MMTLIESDTSIQLNTKDGYTEFTTKKLTGSLKAIIIDCPKVDIQIFSELGYKIMDIRDCEGYRYLPITTRKLDELGHGLDDGCHFFLNEKLIVKINGGKDREVKILFRLE